MKKSEFLTLLDRMLELPEGTLTGTEALTSLEQWDSLATVSFMALADRNFGVTIATSDISNAETVADLLKLLGDKLT